MDHLLTTKEAADMTGVLPGSFRAWAARYRRRTGNDLHADRELWPDSRSPRWRGHAVAEAREKSRQGSRTDLKPGHARPAPSRSDIEAALAAWYGEDQDDAWTGDQRRRMTEALAAPTTDAALDAWLTYNWRGDHSDDIVIHRAVMSAIRKEPI